MTNSTNTFVKILTKIFGSQNDRLIKNMQMEVEQINTHTDAIAALSDEQLKAKTAEFKQRLADKQTLDDILPEAFAVMREASTRVMKMRHFDVQLIGGITLHRGNIAEMTTGEGKTLVATLPAYLNALSDCGVHVITVNDYLAKRDRDWMAPVYEFLGLSVGVILSDIDNDARIAAYKCDITYGTNNEFGFDYLRDNMKMQKEDQAQKHRGFTIIDEVDSILIDESRTPLIISGPAEDTPARYYEVDEVVRKLKNEEHFKVSEKDKSALLTDEGIAECERLLDIENFYDGDHMELPHYIENSLKAHFLFLKDKDYVVEKGEVVIVDEFTGRLMEGRRWSDGLHQATEAKEGLKIKKENQTLATITFQNFFKLYGKISGMTGTALTEAGEFHSIYGLDVICIPTNKPRRRNDQPDLIFGSEMEKYTALAEEVSERHKSGQPILVGTIAIEKSEQLSAIFVKHGIKHEVLNAKQHMREADVISAAGRKGSVTIATNMAGRGTDIVLGGNPEVMAKAQFDPETDPEKHGEALASLTQSCAKERDEIMALGGLYVVASERHESRRIDNQLRGRCGRQGDPGETRFYLSLDDDLMRIFAGDWVRNFMQKMGLSDGQPIEHNILSRQIEKAQKKVESHNFEVRKTLLEYDEVMNAQRTIVYGQRQEILEQKGLKEMIMDMMENSVERIVESCQVKKTERAPKEDSESEDSESTEAPSGKNLNNQIQQRFNVDISDVDITENKSENIFKAISEQYSKREEEFGEMFKEFEQFLLLETIDNKWKDHLRAMDHLRDGINLRAMGGKDPKIEYKREGFSLFEDMAYNIRDEVSSLVMRVEINGPMEHQEIWNATDDPDEMLQMLQMLNASAPPRPSHPSPQTFESGGGEPQVTDPIRRDEAKVGRNDPCPCGSNKKYKQCCGRNG